MAMIDEKWEEEGWLSIAVGNEEGNHALLGENHHYQAETDHGSEGYGFGSVDVGHFMH
jgi:hypothetical protein